MNLQQRIDLLVDLGKHMLSENAAWTGAKQKASAQNGWFTEQFIDTAVKNIVTEFLQKDKLESWCKKYSIKDKEPKRVGVVMAGNIPLVGFHDFLCVFISGHNQIIKPSSKDETLIRHIVSYLAAQNPGIEHIISFSEMLKGCDAYIATGSNNSARYFDYYFSKYPHLIRRNRTSVAILDGDENNEELGKLSSDISLFFGLGCRNVTKIYVPLGYDFVPLLTALKRFDYFFAHHKYKNNYDYQLAILIMNNKYYMTNGSIIFSENDSVFSPVSVVHVEYYKNCSDKDAALKNSKEIQCVVGKNHLAFGETQRPALADYADGIDTMQFLNTLG